MSLHAQLTQETLDRLNGQQRNSTISSIVIAILLMVLVGISLLFILLNPIEYNAPGYVTYYSDADNTEKNAMPEIKRNVHRNPSPPSCFNSSPITAIVQSKISIPIPPEAAPVTQMALASGRGESDGSGWGNSEGWNGSKGPTFFNIPVTGKRILFVIDYSASMRGERQRLMREELANSVKMLPHSTNYQMIFFAGPAWVAGNTVNMNGKKSATIIADDKQFTWISQASAHRWSPQGERQRPTWLSATDSQIKTSEEIIRTNRLIWGTNWENPFNMALEMTPPPETIIFMTDGLAGGNPLALAGTIADRAKKSGTVINTIALMQPAAAAAMEKLASETGGTFYLINEDDKQTKK